MKMRKIIRTLILALMLLSLLAGCGTSTRDIDLSKVVSATADPNEPRQDPKPFLDNYVQLLNAYNFGACYALLAPDTQEAITLVDFTQRYQNIFDGIDFQGLTISYGDLTVEPAKCDADLFQCAAGRVHAGRGVQPGLFRQ